MFLIPVGLIFVFFYINVQVGNHVVDILPDAVGYLLIAANAWKFRGKSDPFSNLVILSSILAAYSMVVRLIVPTGMAGIAASLLELILQLYLLKMIVAGVEDIGRTVGAHLNADVLNRWRLWLSGAWTAVFVCATAGALAQWLAVVGLLVVAVWAVLCLLFLVTLFRTSHRYKLLRRFGASTQDQEKEDDSTEET